MDATNPDLEQLRLLAIFHYVFAALVALFALLPVFHLALGLLMVAGKLGGKPDDLAVERFFGAFIAAFAAAWIAAGLAFAASLFFAGRSLARQRHHLYCVVIAGLECFLMPFGTVLGILALITLESASVRALFAPAAAAARA